MNPLMLAALFAGGSALANNQGAKAQDSARAAAMESERIRQKQWDDQSFALNKQSQERFQDVEGQQTERSDNLSQMFKDVEMAKPQTAMPAAPPQSDNVVVQNRNAESAAEGKEYTDNRAEALSNFRSFGDVLGEAGRGTTRDAGELSTINSFRRGSRSVLPAELEAAQEAGGGWRLLGDALGLASQSMTGSALGGSAMPGGGGFNLAALFGGGGGRIGTPGQTAGLFGGGR